LPNGDVVTATHSLGTSDHTPDLQVSWHSQGAGAEQAASSNVIP
jgi:hypothetical protein